MKRFIILLFILSCFFGSYVRSADFEANVPAIRSVVRTGESAVYPIIVSNQGNAQNFSLEYFGERGFILIKEPEFYLDENEEYSFDLTLGSTDIPSGVFIGKIVISGAKESITIPVNKDISLRQSGNGNSFYGKKHSEESKKKMLGADLKIFHVNHH